MASVDISFQAHSIQQAEGRVVRISQKVACMIYILTTDFLISLTNSCIILKKTIRYPRDEAQRRPCDS